jgi:hypothetical protein
MSAHLLRLERAGRRLVTPELGRGEITRYEEGAYRAFVEPMDRDVELGPVDDAIDRVLADKAAFDSTIDADAAPELHRALRLSRREAADMGVWRYLAVVHRPDFIRHRWQFRTWGPLKTRFWAAGTRHDSNTFCRLWWIAELTTDGDDYGLTRRVLANQSLAIQLFVRGLSRYRPAVEAAAEVLSGKPGGVVEHALLRLYRHGSIAPLEGLSATEIAALLRGWADAQAPLTASSHGGGESS